MCASPAFSWVPHGRGLQFAIANWTFLDAAILSAHARPPHETEPVLVHVTFVDWVPGICSLLGMLVVSLIDKDRVRGEDGFGDSSAVWRARLFLFISFALMAGGLAGSVVSGSFFFVWFPHFFETLLPSFLFSNLVSDTRV